MGTADQPGDQLLGNADKRKRIRNDTQSVKVRLNDFFLSKFDLKFEISRLWLKRRDIDDDDDIEPLNGNGYSSTNLKFIDFVPKRLSGNAFETVDDLLSLVNVRIKQTDAVRWKLITLESLKVEARPDWSIDTEASLAEEAQRHLTILRLYYEECDIDNVLMRNAKHALSIGVEDFKPRHLSGGSFFKRPQFEPFSSLVQRATNWLASQSAVCFLNAQSIDIKVKSCKLFLKVNFN